MASSTQGMQTSVVAVLPRNYIEMRQNNSDMAVEELEEGEASDDVTVKHKDDRNVKSSIKKCGNTSILKNAHTSRGNRQLLKSLGLTESDFKYGGWRHNALHVRGVENMNSHDILTYFKDYDPLEVEPVSKSSCNVVWMNSTGPLNALRGLTCPIQSNKVPDIQDRSDMEEMSDIESSATNKKLKKTASSEPSKKKEKATLKEISSESDSESSSESDESSSDSESSSYSDSSSSSESSTDSDESSSSSESSSSESKSKLIKKNIPPVKQEKRDALKVVSSVISQPFSEEASITVDEIGVPVPRGHWRLGVPCPKAKALFIRFAHQKDTHENAIDINFSSERPTLLSSVASVPQTTTRELNPVLTIKHSREERRHRRLSGGHRTHRSSTRTSVLSRLEKRWPRKPDDAGMWSSNRNYKDLDDPIGDMTEERNPWYELAVSWGTKEREKPVDYSDLLQEYIASRGRKRRFSGSSHDDIADYPNSDDDDWDIHNNGNDNAAAAADDDDDDDDDDFDDSSIQFNWRSKSKMPRMRMHADEEERRRSRGNKGVSLRKRLATDRYVRRPSLFLSEDYVASKFPVRKDDLRLKLLGRRRLKR